MGKVKDPPCLNGCPFYRNCVQYFSKRKKEYDKDRDLCEDYNSESIYELGHKCEQLNKYLFLDQVSFPSRNMHFFWWSEMRHKISEMAWIERSNLFRNLFEAFFVPDSM